MVSLCLIVRNEIQNIKNLVEKSRLVFDEVVIVDTGSTDGTLEYLQSQDIKLHQFEWIDDFSAARNFAFQQATGEWIAWLDADDLPYEAEAFAKFKAECLTDNSVDCWLLDYVYSRYPNGEPQSILTRERFLRRSANPRWLGMIHETVDISAMRQKYWPHMRVIHNRDRLAKVVDPKRNLRILEKEHQKNPNDARTAYYYAKELFDHIDPRAKEQLEKYLNTPGRYWDDECNARWRLAKIYLHEKRHRDALKCAEEIYHLDSSRNRSEMYFVYGEVEQDLGNYKAAIKWFERCLVDPPGNPRVLSLEFYTWHPRKKIAECYGALRDYHGLFGWARSVERLLPDDPNIKGWIRSLKQYRLQPKSGPLVVMEFGLSDDEGWKTLVPLRGDSHTDAEIGCDFLDLPFADASLDGAVFHDLLDHGLGDVVRCIKPGGFLWTIYPLDSTDRAGLNYIGCCEFNGRVVYNHVKQRPELYSIGFMDGPADFGPYRIRIGNLRKSAAKAGFPIRTGRDAYSADFYVTTHPNGLIQSSTTVVLDICEKLPSYNQESVARADVINCSSDLLREHLQAMFPDKPVICIEDHFEMPDREWL
jgi:glycosyltransferase involved in cell wall biosynthesis